MSVMSPAEVTGLDPATLEQCAAQVPVAPAVGALRKNYDQLFWLRTVPVCGVLFRCMYSALVGGLPFVARAALLACVRGMAFLVRVCLRWFPALVSDCLYMPNHCISL